MKTSSQRENWLAQRLADPWISKSQVICFCHVFHEFCYPRVSCSFARVICSKMPRVILRSTFPLQGRLCLPVQTNFLIFIFVAWLPQLLHKFGLQIRLRFNFMRGGSLAICGNFKQNITWRFFLSFLFLLFCPFLCSWYGYGCHLWHFVTRCYWKKKEEKRGGGECHLWPSLCLNKGRGRIIM